MSPNDLRSLSVEVLAGGRGACIGRAADDLPKSLVEVGRQPILWAILRLHEPVGVRKRTIETDYLADRIGEKFGGSPTGQVLDTGLSANTARRVRWLDAHLTESLYLTYADGLSDLQIAHVVEFHRPHEQIAAIALVGAEARYGPLAFTGRQVNGFLEQLRVSGGWINGGFMAFERSGLNWITHDSNSLSDDVLPKPAAEGQLVGYRGFWQCVDTKDDVDSLDPISVAVGRTW